MRHCALRHLKNNKKVTYEWGFPYIRNSIAITGQAGMSDLFYITTYIVRIKQIIELIRTSIL